jgi:glycosyltransferase involved in cell wall biosynthesis
MGICSTSYGNFEESNDMKRPTVSVVVFCQYNPLAASASGGIGTLIRSYIRNAPSDFAFEVIGVSDDMVAFPPGQWSVLSFGDLDVPFFPVMVDLGLQNAVPLSIRYSYQLYKYRNVINCKGKILHFHRPEPALPFLNFPAKKVLFIHNSVGEFANQSKTVEAIRGFSMRSINKSVEDVVIPSAEQVYAVRSSFVKEYHKRYPSHREHIAFMPTWVDEQFFSPLSTEQRLQQRTAMKLEYGWDDEGPWLVSVGRLEAQKDPLLLLETFDGLRSKLPGIRLLVIGDGSMRSELEAFIKQKNLGSSVILLGNIDHKRLPLLLAACDIFMLTSAYEGMPVALLESLACGVPVVATNVGEVERVLSRGGGYMSPSRDTSALIETVLQVVSHSISTEQCLQVVEPFTSKSVLSGIYKDHYRIFEQNLHLAS